jgi:hypothetical protein
MGAILSFIGGSAFRLVWEAISSFLKASQEHRHEIERMKVQAEAEAAAHARNLEAIRVQAELGVKTIAVQADADMARAEVDAWAQAVANAGKPSGIWIIDAWNGAIRPLCASISVVLWVMALNAQGWKMTQWDQELVGVVLGFFFASRALTKK